MAQDIEYLKIVQRFCVSSERKGKENQLAKGRRGQCGKRATVNIPSSSSPIDGDVWHRCPRSLHGCQMAIARILDHMCLALRASGLWLRHATLQNPIPSFHGLRRAGGWGRNLREGRDQILPSGNLGSLSFSLFLEEG